MSDRLAELRRQRALVQEHLAWLDREIAAARSPSALRTDESGPASAATPTALPHPATSPIVPAPAPAPPFVVGVTTAPATFASSATPPSASSPPTSEAEALFADYKVEPASVRENVKKGCLLYFAAAFALLVGVVVVLYFALSSR